MDLSFYSLHRDLYYLLQKKGQYNVLKTLRYCQLAQMHRFRLMLFCLSILMLRQ